MAEYGYKIKTAPSVEPVSLTEAKAQLRILTAETSEDTNITRIIKAAREQIENACGRAIITQSWYLVLDSFPNAAYFNGFYRYCEDHGDCDSDRATISMPRTNNYSEILFPLPPLQSITSIKYLDINGTEQTLTSTKYRVDTINEPGRVIPAYGETWPDTQPTINAVTIEFKCGFGDAASSVPEALRDAILLLVSHKYDNRDSVAVGQSVNVMPLGVQALIDQYRIVRF